MADRELAPPPPPTRRIAITGATGLVGRALATALRARGDTVLAIGRTPRSAFDIGWDPTRKSIDANKLEGLHAVVHLAGENIAEGRWTARKKRSIVESRVAGTTLIAETLGRLQSPPAVLVSASAIGFYGDRGDEVLDDMSAPGTGFLAETCLAWEAAAAPAARLGTRLCHPRIGIVLTPQGGMLARMLLPFRLGLGGRLGNGRQWISWIALADLVTILVRAIDDATLNGPFVATAPNPVTNAEFTRTLAATLHRPAFLPVPGFALKLLMGEMGQTLALGSMRVLPRRLLALGHAFATPSLAGALESMIRRS